MRSRPLLVAARVTAAEKALVEAAAEAEGLPVAEFILRTVINRAEQSLQGPDSIAPTEPSRQAQKRSA